MSQESISGGASTAYLHRDLGARHRLVESYTWACGLALPPRPNQSRAVQGGKFHRRAQLGRGGLLSIGARADHWSWNSWLSGWPSGDTADGRLWLKLERLRGHWHLVGIVLGRAVMVRAVFPARAQAAKLRT